MSKTILITGAGTGIGKDTALALAARGHRVLATTQTDAQALALQAVATAQNLHLETFKLDITSEADRELLTQYPIDVLINNAGTNRPKPLWDVTEADYDAVLDLNLKSAFFVAQACAKRLIETGTPGSLIHMGSQMGHVGYPGRMLYCTAKHAIEGMAKALGVEWAPHGITVNAVLPGGAATPGAIHAKGPAPEGPGHPGHRDHAGLPGADDCEVRQR